MRWKTLEPGTPLEVGHIYLVLTRRGTIHRLQWAGRGWVTANEVEVPFHLTHYAESVDTSQEDPPPTVAQIRASLEQHPHLLWSLAHDLHVSIPRVLSPWAAGSDLQSSSYYRNDPSGFSFSVHFKRPTGATGGGKWTGMWIAGTEPPQECDRLEEAQAAMDAWLREQGWTLL